MEEKLDVTTVESKSLQMRFAVGVSETEKREIESIEKKFFLWEFVFWHKNCRNFHYRDDEAFYSWLTTPQQLHE
jgi:hypothetical protein